MSQGTQRSLAAALKGKLRSWIILRPVFFLRDDWRRRALRGPRLMASLARQFPELNFVQVGSNDGQKHDPIHATVMTMGQWKGVMIEPVPYVFRRLEQTYSGVGRFRLENVAIANQAGSLPFYHLREAAAGEQLPDWYDELGSFFKDVLLKHAYAIPDIEQRLTCTQVPCMRLDQLCEKHALQPLGLLHIDTEGYDYEVIKSIDFQIWRPLLLIYEHKHLSESDRAECDRLLKASGYACHSEGQDTWCADMRGSSAQAANWWLSVKRYFES